VVVPVTLLALFLLLFYGFNSLANAALLSSSAFEGIRSGIS